MFLIVVFLIKKRVCMNLQFEAGNVPNVFLIFEDFVARCSYKIFLLKKECIYSLISLINCFLMKNSVKCEMMTMAMTSYLRSS